ncbi:MAG: hypothetical protein LW860_06700 [Xanthomonadaceae bacterium]|nr:hypothetical protein [Xanthomonadaceae bacterium]
MDAPRERSIEYIGGSDEERAHLRLLLRSLAPRLRSAWRWGAEDSADLLVVDPDVVAGEMARTRALESGVRCVVVTSTPGAVAGDFVLPRPLRAEDFQRVLDAASLAAESTAAPMVQGGDVFDLGDGATDDDSWQAQFAHLDLDAPAPPPPPGLDEAEALFRRDPLSDKPSVLMPDPLDMKTAVEWTGEGTLRSELRMTRADIRSGGGAPNIDPAMRRIAPKDDTWHTLVEFLADGMLGGPARIAPPDLPALVLDPKERAYHAAVGLSALEPYCRLQMKRSYWVPLTGADLALVRGESDPQPYDRLRWLDALLKGTGSLARHLDPGGVYRLRQWFKIAHDYPRAYRISAAMLRPARLHEVAAATGLPMAEVFDVVNAWDVIGFVEWQPRERLRGEAGKPTGG